MKYCYGCMKKLEENEQICPACGYDQSTPPLQIYYLNPGTEIQNRYLIGRVIGYGGFGITYVGYDRILKRKVAVKEYFPSDYAVREAGSTLVRCNEISGQGNFRRGLEGFKKEAKSLARLGEIRGVVKVFDCVDENNTAYIIMEFLEGKSLKEILTERRRIPYAEAGNYILHILFTLSKVHREGVIHRDIAPDNVFVLKNKNEVKLIDFGSARYAFSEQSNQVSIILKPGYAPLEQYISNSRQGPWTDLYGVGATFYRMVTGEIPIEASARAVKDVLVRPSKLCRIPPEGERVILKAMEVGSELRYQNAEAFMQDLMAAAGKAPSANRERRAASGEGSQERSRQRAKMAGGMTEADAGEEALEKNRQAEGMSRRNRFRIGLAACILGLLAAAAAGGVYWLRKGRVLTAPQQIYRLSRDETVKEGGIRIDLHTESGERSLTLWDEAKQGNLQLYISRSGELSRTERKEAFSEYARMQEGEEGFVCFAYDEIGYEVDFSAGGCVIDAPDPSKDYGLVDLTVGSKDQAECIYSKISFRDIIGIGLGIDADHKADLTLYFANLSDEKEPVKVQLFRRSTEAEASGRIDAYPNPDPTLEKSFSIKKGGRVILCGEYEAADKSRWKLVRKNAVYGFIPADAVDF